MTEEKKDAEGMVNEKKKEAQEESPPVCTTTPTPEHSRFEDTDEPCDDGRAGK